MANAKKTCDGLAPREGGQSRERQRAGETWTTHPLAGARGSDGTHRHVRRSIASIVCLLIASLAFAQSKPDQVQLRTDLVQLRAVVTDAKGAVVGGLSREDFEVVDGGQAQAIEFFSENRIPIGPSAAGVLPAPVMGIAAPAPSYGPAEPAVRTIVLFVDDEHLSGNSLSRIRVALKRFVAEQLSTTDLLGLFCSSGRVKMFGQFGADRSALLAAIDALPIAPSSSWRGGFTPFLASRIKLNDPEAINAGIAIMRALDHDNVSSDEAMQRRAESFSTEILSEETSFRRAVLDTLRRLCDQLAALPGQRLILMYSDGFALRDRDGVIADADVRAVVSHAARAGVVVSAIIASGLSVSGADNLNPTGGGDTGPSHPQDPPSSLNPMAGQYGPVSPGYGIQLARGQARELEMGPGTVAKQTGGILYSDTNDIEKLGRETLARNAIYYSLAYYAPDPESTAYRDVEIRVRNHPDYSVRGQTGYVPLEHRPAPIVSKDPKIRLIESLVRPVLPTDLYVALELGGLTPAKDKSQLQLRAIVGGSDLGLKDVGDGRFPLNIDVTTVVYDLAGSPAFVGSDHVSGILTTEQADAVKESGLRYTVPVDPLKPGVYQVRVAFSDPTTGRVGARALWISVPKHQN